MDESIRGESEIKSPVKALLVLLGSVGGEEERDT